jgi:plasmid stabilization system protein ParE
MAFELFVTAEALADLAELQEYLAGLDPVLAERVSFDLERIMRREIAGRPSLHSWFYLTGAPFRARLFRLSRRTQFWIIYEVKEDTELVMILRLWNASRDPAAFEL